LSSWQFWLPLSLGFHHYSFRFYFLFLLVSIVPESLMHMILTILTILTSILIGLLALVRVVLRRVTPVEFIEEGREQVYDKEKYREMLLEAAETVLGYFGFDRTAYGGISRSKNRKWWHQLREQRQKT
jgi:hypothetical protein